MHISTSAPWTVCMHLSNVRSWSSHTSVLSIRCQHTYCHASIFRVFIMCVIFTEDDLDRPNRMTKMRLLLDTVPSDTNWSTDILSSSFQSILWCSDMWFGAYWGNLGSGAAEIEQGRGSPPGSPIFRDMSPQCPQHILEPHSACRERKQRKSASHT